MSNRGRRPTAGASSSRAPESEGDPRIEEMMRVLTEVSNLMARQAAERAATVAQAAEAALAAANGANGGNGHGNGGRQTHHIVEQFLKLQPSRFDGSGGPEVAALWIEQLEKAFTVLGCADEEKVSLATYQLQGTADDWWKATRGRVFPDGMRPNWAAFCAAFNGKYFSEAA